MIVREEHEPFRPLHLTSGDTASEIRIGLPILLVATLLLQRRWFEVDGRTKYCPNLMVFAIALPRGLLITSLCMTNLLDQ
jgi:hypothetical protein